MKDLYIHLIHTHGKDFVRVTVQARLLISSRDSHPRD